MQNRIRMAMQAQRAGRLETAKSVYLEVLESEPNHPDALHLYGLACHQQGDYQNAIKYMQRVVALVPDQAVLRNNLGEALRCAGELRSAAKQLQKALDLKPGYAGAHLNMGSVYYDAKIRDKAVLHARSAVRLDPERAEAWFNLGLILLDRAELAESSDSFQRALAIRPQYPTAAASYLYTLNLLPGLSPPRVAAEHMSVADRLFGPPAQWRGTRAAGSRIRIAYVSGDFRSHAVNFFFEPVLEHHNRSCFEIWCYSDVGEPDATTERLKRHASHWCDIRGMTDEDVFRKIREDRIDVLVDLAGYTQHNRLGVFARRAAPCQISWLGYPNTTGLAAMDYRVVDKVSAPVAARFEGTESPLRLSGGFACFRPPEYAPGVSAAPCVEKDFVTLGSFHKLDKLNPEVLDTWAAILNRCRTTRLRLLRDELDDWHQDRLIAAFRQRGIGPDQVMMTHFDPSAGSFLEHFQEIDLQLDCFPWSGHTMACMALWMGVPVLTLRGDDHHERMVASVLESLGLEAFVTEDPESYVNLGVELCRNPERLAKLRSELRPRMASSSLRDEKAFTRQFEEKLLAVLAKT